MILILSPVYHAWDRVIQMCKAIDENTVGSFTHVLCLDSCDMPQEIRDQISTNHRLIIKYDDGELPEKHRPCITKALQKAWEYGSPLFMFDHLFVVETDVMVPKDWNFDMIFLSQFLPNWVTLDALPVDESGATTYPAKDHNIRRRHETFGEHNFEVVLYGDWNCLLFAPAAVLELKAGLWRFDDVPSHHDILLSRNFREKWGYERENWDPALFYRTDEVKVVHYANSSRSELPEGLSTPSNPA